MSETTNQGAPAPTLSDVDLIFELRFDAIDFEQGNPYLANSDWVKKSAKARQVADRLEALTAEVAALKEALRFYADPEIYKPHPHGPAFDRRDLSWRARTALKEAGDAA